MSVTLSRRSVRSARSAYPARRDHTAITMPTNAIEKRSSAATDALASPRVVDLSNTTAPSIAAARSGRRPATGSGTEIRAQSCRVLTSIEQRLPVTRGHGNGRDDRNAPLPLRCASGSILGDQPLERRVIPFHIADQNVSSVTREPAGHPRSDTKRVPLSAGPTITSTLRPRSSSARPTATSPLVSIRRRAAPAAPERWASTGAPAISSASNEERMRTSRDSRSATSSNPTTSPTKRPTRPLRTRPGLRRVGVNGPVANGGVGTGDGTRTLSRRDSGLRDRHSRGRSRAGAGGFE